MNDVSMLPKQDLTQHCLNEPTHMDKSLVSREPPLAEVQSLQPIASQTENLSNRIITSQNLSDSTQSSYKLLNPRVKERWVVNPKYRSTPNGHSES